ncbi:hypothetical protein C8T65DRAFT_701507 [Cerioporus squamosus]|nr:hypothetical protein C8T65DRAFT_701507 [Cerioporus squamosus]
MTTITNRERVERRARRAQVPPSALPNPSTLTTHPTPPTPKLAPRANTRTTPQTIPPPNPAQPLILLAKWTGLGHPSPKIYAHEKGRHKYRLVVWPTEPITTGKRVKILALSPIVHHVPKVPPNQYDTRDPHVVGRVIEVKRGVKRMKMGREVVMTIIHVENECMDNMVEGVELEMPAGSEESILPERRGRKRRRGSNTETVTEGIEPELLASVRPWPIDPELECRESSTEQATI